MTDTIFFGDRVPSDTLPPLSKSGILEPPFR